MAALQLISLDTTTPRLRAPGSGDTYSAPRAMDIAPESLTGSAATSSLSIAQTWNTSGTPTAIDLNVTDTASNASSRLLNLRVGGTSLFRVDKNGAFGSETGASVILSFGSVRFGLGASGANVFQLRSDGFIAWGATTTIGGASDTILARDAANTLAQRNGTAAQAFNIYNTFTDASNYERGFVRWSSNLFDIGTERLGTGTNRRMRLMPGSGEISFGDEFGIVLDTLRVTASNKINWSSLDNNINNGFDDLGLSRAAAGILFVNNGATGGAAIQMVEQTAPAAPATNGVRIYAEDNGSGKTRLMALFATGAAQQLAIEP